MESRETIILIGEGEKIEKNIQRSLEKHFFKNSDTDIQYIFIPFKTHIYSLYNQLRKDDFETSTIEILKEQNKKSKTILEKFEDSQISQIFLFFDYDGHARDNVTSRHTELQELLEHFDNETEDGKLYISYPMAESLKDFTEKDACFRNCTTDISLGKKYKSTVADISHYNYPNLCSMKYLNIIKEKLYEN